MPTALARSVQFEDVLKLKIQQAERSMGVLKEYSERVSVVITHMKVTIPV